MSQIHTLDCACHRCEPDKPLSRRGMIILLAIGVALGALCDGAGLPDPFALIGVL